MNENLATTIKFENRTVIGIFWEKYYQFFSNTVTLGMQITPGRISRSGEADQQVINSFLCMILFDYNLVICFDYFKCYFILLVF